jgi:hypothetical protein
MELSPSRETTSCVAAQELPNILSNPKVYYRDHNRPLDPYPEPDQFSPYLSILLSTHLRISLPSGLFPSAFSTNIL